MRQSTRIDDDGIDAFLPGCLDAVDQCTFMIALERGQAGAGLTGLLDGSTFDIGKRCGAVDLRLACAEQVQVRAVQQKKVSCHGDKTPFADDRGILPLNGVDWQEESIADLLSG